DLSIREVGPGTDRLYITQGGGIGINTTAPFAALEVLDGGNFGMAIYATQGSANGSCIDAITSASHATGVYASVAGTSATAVYGEAINAGAGSPVGIFGFAGNTGTAVYAEGRFAATGTKAFQIDHPLDPQNKYLNHYCEEGPEPLNVYRGTVTLDE